MLMSYYKDEKGIEYYKINYHDHCHYFAQIKDNKVTIISHPNELLYMYSKQRQDFAKNKRHYQMQRLTFGMDEDVIKEINQIYADYETEYRNLEEVESLLKSVAK